MRIISEQNADCIFQLSDLPLQFGNLRICRVEHLLGLQYIELCSDTVIQPQLGQVDCVLLCRNRVASDLQLQIKREQLEVVTRNVAD